MTPKISFLLAFFIFALISLSHAQCDECGGDAGFEPEFCYTDILFSDYCMQFSSVSEQAYFHTGGEDEGRMIPLKHGASMAHLLTLAKDDALAITAEEILFLQFALKAWENKKMEMVVKEAGEKVYTGEELGAMEFAHTESGLGYQLLYKGNGPNPANGKNVSVHYRGYLADGKVFDASFDRGQPIVFPLGTGRVIKGWDEGIAKFGVGSRAMLKIPPELGYGDRDMGNGLIPANSTLYFDIVIVDTE